MDDKEKDELELSLEDFEDMSPADFRHKIVEGRIDSKKPQDLPWKKTTLRYVSRHDTFLVDEGDLVFNGAAAVVSMLFEWGIPNGSMSYALKNPDIEIPTFRLEKKCRLFHVTNK